jgi:hypothetical protein
MEKLVEANSFPNVELNGAVAFTDKPDQLVLSLGVENSGVGPARIETIELWENGRPLRSARDIGTEINKIYGSHFDANIEGGTVLGSLIGPGKNRNFIGYKFDGAQKWYPTLSKTLFGLQSRICYCSVFDECHVTDSRIDRGHPKSVKHCPVPEVPYDDNFSDMALKGGLPKN